MVINHISLLFQLQLERVDGCTLQLGLKLSLYFPCCWMQRLGLFPDNVCRSHHRLSLSLYGKSRELQDPRFLHYTHSWNLLSSVNWYWIEWLRRTKRADSLQSLQVFSPKRRTLRVSPGPWGMRGADASEGGTTCFSYSISFPLSSF